MSEKRFFILSHDTARRTASACCMMPEYTGYSVRIEPPTRTLEQSARMWAMLGEIARQVEWYGRKLGAEDWKHIFTSSLRKMDVVPNIEGTGFVALGLATSKMTKKELSDLMLLIECFGSEKGVKFNDQA